MENRLDIEIIRQIHEINPAINSIIGTSNGIDDLTLIIAKKYDLNHFQLGCPVSEISSLLQTYKSRSWNADRALLVVGKVESSNLSRVVDRIKKEGHIQISKVLSIHSI